MSCCNTVGYRILPLRVRGLGYEAGGRRLLQHIDAVFEPGARTLVLGPNGAGKSLLLRLCHGLLRPTAGTVEWLGPEPGAARAYQAMVFQRPVMLRRSAWANIDYALAVRAVPRGARGARVAQMLEETGLTPVARQPARTLSGGEQQRLALARAWALRPEVLFLDEPATNLDPGAAHAVESIIRAISAAGTKIIMTTHDLAQAHRLADEVLFLNNGRLVERSAARAFFARPESPEARAFLEGRLWQFGNSGASP